MLYKKIIIRNIYEEISGFKTFEFEGGHDISYKAGQYLTLILQTTHEELRRSYSITSVPLLHEPLTIGVKRIANGLFSRQLTDYAQPGDIVLTTGAAGLFVLPENIDQYNQIVFLAAGSGITPVYSLLKTCLHFHPHLDLVLIYSNASPERTIFYESLLRLKENFPKFRLHLLFSNSRDLQRARLNRESLTTLTSHYLFHPKEKILFYTCGPEAYMRMCIYTLQEEEVPKENIRRESFNIEKLSPPKAPPPDQEPHLVNIRYGEDRHSLTVRYPESILQAAKRRGINLPYSCEVGRCGNCAAKCLEGRVWMSYNEVLTEKDLKEGLILTCVGHPVGGDVVLEI